MLPGRQWIGHLFFLVAKRARYFFSPSPSRRSSFQKKLGGRVGCKLPTKTCMVANKLYICAARHRVAVPAFKDFFPIAPYHPMPMESPPPRSRASLWEMQRSETTSFLHHRVLKSKICQFRATGHIFFRLSTRKILVLERVVDDPYVGGNILLFSYISGLHAAKILAWGAVNLRSNLEKKTEFKGVNRFHASKEYWGRVCVASGCYIVWALMLALIAPTPPARSSTSRSRRAVSEDSDGSH